MTYSRFRIGHTLVLTGAALAVAAVASAATPGPVVVVKKMLSDFNSGDVKGAMAATADNGVVVDEFAPNQWQGPGAFSAWLAGLGGWEKARGRTGDNMKVLSVARSEMEGQSAYVVLHMLYSFKEHGRPLSEPGDFAFVLHDGPGGWKITGMSWAGGRPASAVVKAKATAAPAVAAAKKS